MLQVQIDPASADLAVQRYARLCGRSGVAPPLQAGLQFTRRHVAFAPSRGVSRIPGATVLSGEWFVLAADRVLCDGYCQTPFPPESAYLAATVAPHILDLIHGPLVDLPVPDAFLLGGCPNYAHWLMDYLPRVDLWTGDAPLLVNSPLMSFQIESLAALGIGQERLIKLDYPQACSVPVLFYPSLHSSFCMPSLPFRYELLDWLRGRFAALKSSASGKRRIFISRAGAAIPAGRRLINSDDIERVAGQHGFEIIASEKMTFAEQVDVFSQADVIAGPHGAGFVNMTFAPPGARVIELIGPRQASQPTGAPEMLRRIASVLQQDFTRLVGQSDDTVPITDGHVSNETFTVDPLEFTKLLDRMR